MSRSINTSETSMENHLNQSEKQQQHHQQQQHLQRSLPLRHRTSAPQVKFNGHIKQLGVAKIKGRATPLPNFIFRDNNSLVCNDCNDSSNSNANVTDDVGVNGNIEVRKYCVTDEIASTINKYQQQTESLLYRKDDGTNEKPAVEEDEGEDDDDNDDDEDENDSRKPSLLLLAGVKETDIDESSSGKEEEEEEEEEEARDFAEDESPDYTPVRYRVTSSMIPHYQSSSTSSLHPSVISSIINSSSRLTNTVKSSGIKKLHSSVLPQTSVNNAVLHSLVTTSRHHNQIHRRMISRKHNTPSHQFHAKSIDTKELFQSNSCALPNSFRPTDQRDTVSIAALDLATDTNSLVQSVSQSENELLTLTPYLLHHGHDPDDVIEQSDLSKSSCQVRNPPHTWYSIFLLLLRRSDGRDKLVKLAYHSGRFIRYFYHLLVKKIMKSSIFHFLIDQMRSGDIRRKILYFSWLLMKKFDTSLASFTSLMGSARQILCIGRCFLDVSDVADAYHEWIQSTSIKNEASSSVRLLATVGFINSVLGLLSDICDDMEWLSENKVLSSNTGLWFGKCSAVFSIVTLMFDMPITGAAILQLYKHKKEEQINKKDTEHQEHLVDHLQLSSQSSNNQIDSGQDYCTNICLSVPAPPSDSPSSLISGTSCDDESISSEILSLVRYCGDLIVSVDGLIHHYGWEKLHNISDGVVQTGGLIASVIAIYKLANCQSLHYLKK